MSEKQEPETAVVGTPAASGAVAGVVIPAGSAAPMPMSQQPKMGGKCCGCCCDYRKAVIIMSIIGIIVLIISLVLSPRRIENISVADDDVYNQIIQIQTDQQRINLIISIVGLCMNVANLIGAVTYVWPMNAVYILWAAIQFALSIYYGLTNAKDVIGIYEEAGVLDDDTIDYNRLVRFSALTGYIIAGAFLVLWVYPTFFFVLECSKGVMTKETYPREEFSCCCSPRYN